MKDTQRCLIVGAGFSGAVVARQLAELAGIPSLVIDQRDHVAGNCHTERDERTQVMLHVYGPHIFHTDKIEVWNYVSRFTTLKPYVHRVKASIDRGVFGLPINLQTINQFFNKRFTPSQAREFVAGLGDPGIEEAANFEEQALKMLGSELYEAFFYGYTKKHWGCEPRELPASILKRLPVRFDYDDNYHRSPYTGIPEHGYTDLVKNILDHPLIETKLGTAYEAGMRDEFSHVFFSGPLDAFYGHEEGRLGYRTVFWERLESEGDYQGCTQMNYPDASVPHTRIHEDSHFTPWEKHERSVALVEFSKETGAEDIPYYPKRLSEDKSVLARYEQRALQEEGVSFIGRLATYRYLDMHVVISEAMNFAETFIRAKQEGSRLPVFPESVSTQVVT